MVAVPLAIALIAAATLTPNAFDPAHRVPPAWCFACGEMWLTDVLSNIALFFPLGAALAWRSVRWPRVLLIALGTSFVVEFCQYIGFPSGRSAASADLLTNTAGAVIGALVVTHWNWLCQPPRRLAMLFAMAWAMLSALVVWVTGVAIGTVVPHDQSAEPLTFVASTRTHPPNFGWYGGVVEQARFDATRGPSLMIRRGWGGPIIAQASRRFDAAAVSVTLRGRDENTAFVPLVYVHVGTDSTPMLMIGQHGGDAELRVWRRAADLGLSMPALRMVGVFASRPVGDTTVMELTARITADMLELSARSAGVHTVVTRRLDVTMGWAMLQTVVPIDSAVAPLALLCWLAALIGPVGWWGGAAVAPIQGIRSAVFQSWRGLVCAIPFLATLVWAPRVSGASPTSPGSTLLIFVVLVAAFLASARRSNRAVADYRDVADRLASR